MLAVFFVSLSAIGGSFLGERQVSRSTAQKPASQQVTRVLQDNDEWLSEKSWERRLSQRRSLMKIRVVKSDDEEEERIVTSWGDSSNESYRTVCVRLCDGYYFPVSFATQKWRLKEDDNACQSRCSGEARLFYCSNVDGSPETMKDLEGRSYTSLKTAFLYRTAYKPSCQCRAAPWTDEAKQRHAMYKNPEWQKEARQLAQAEHRKELQKAKYARSRVATWSTGRKSASTKQSRQASSSQTSRSVASKSPASYRSNRMSLGVSPSVNRPRASPRPSPRVVQAKKQWRKKILFGVGGSN